MKYLLRNCDLMLIQEAIKLGDKLKQLPEATREITENIGKLQDVLRKIPEYIPDVDAEYYFGQYCMDEDFQGAIRGWGVCTQRSGSLWVPVLFSICTFVPYDLERGFEEEDYFEFLPESRPINDCNDYQRWISQVQDPGGSWRDAHLDFEVKADFQVVSTDSDSAPRASD